MDPTPLAFSFPDRPLIGIGCVVAAALLLLAATEASRRARWPSELTRKLAHVGAGLIALTFPSLFDDLWPVLLLAAGFTGLMLAGRALGVLSGIHGVDRKTFGAYVFPLVVPLLFYLADGDALVFRIPILVLSVSDAAAALVGKRYGSVHFRSAGEVRSVEGSAAFLVLAFLAVQLPLLLTARTGRLEAVLIALLVAVLVTAFEALSVRGLDNLFIPYGTFFALTHFLRDPLPELWKQVALLVLFAGAGILLWRSRLLTPTGASGATLIAYAAYNLGGPEWFWPLPPLYAALAIGSWMGREHPLPPLGLRGVFHAALVPFVLLLLHDLTRRGSLWLPYLASVFAAAALLLLTRRFSAEAMRNRIVLSGSAAAGLAASLFGWARG